jgi:hypothetical protein
LGPWRFLGDFSCDHLGNFFGNYLGDHLRGFRGLLLVSLPQHQKKHKSNQQDYDQYQGGHQRDSPGAHVSPFGSLAACVLPSILGHATEKQEPESSGLQEPVGR